MKTIKDAAKESALKTTTVGYASFFNGFESGAEFAQRFISIEDELPELKQIVIAKCEFSTGEISHNIITRIPTKQSTKGWQWSGERMNSYFTLKVISWRPLELK